MTIYLPYLLHGEILPDVLGAFLQLQSQLRFQTQQFLLALQLTTNLQKAICYIHSSITSIPRSMRNVHPHIQPKIIFAMAPNQCNQAPWPEVISNFRLHHEMFSNVFWNDDTDQRSWFGQLGMWSLTGEIAELERSKIMAHLLIYGNVSTLNIIENTLSDFIIHSHFLLNCRQFLLKANDASGERAERLKREYWLSIDYHD